MNSNTTLRAMLDRQLADGNPQHCALSLTPEMTAMSPWEAPSSTQHNADTRAGPNLASVGSWQRMRSSSAL